MVKPQQCLQMCCSSNGTGEAGGAARAGGARAVPGPAGSWLGALQLSEQVQVLGCLLMRFRWRGAKVACSKAWADSARPWSQQRWQAGGGGPASIGEGGVR